MSLNINPKKLLFVVNILLFTVLAVPGAVVAKSPIDLVFGAMGSVPWNESGIQPGSHGSTSIELINQGTLEGTLYVWVDNVSQTDAFGDGAALGKYMYFSIGHPNLVSTIPLPSRIDAFPSAPWTAEYLIIDLVRPREKVTLNWTWEFVEIGQLQNDAMGDSLRFNISFMLVNETLSPPITPNPTISPRRPSFRHEGGSGSGGIQLSPDQLSTNVTPTKDITPVQNSTLVSTPEMSKSIPTLSDYCFIVTIGLFILIIALIVNSQRKQN